MKFEAKTCHLLHFMHWHVHKSVCRSNVLTGVKWLPRGFRWHALTSMQNRASQLSMYWGQCHNLLKSTLRTLKTTAETLVSYTDFIALAPSRQTCLSGGSERNKVCVRDYWDTIYRAKRKVRICTLPKSLTLTPSIILCCISVTFVNTITEEKDNWELNSYFWKKNHMLGKRWEPDPSFWKKKKKNHMVRGKN